MGILKPSEMYCGESLISRGSGVLRDPADDFRSKGDLVGGPSDAVPLVREVDQLCRDVSAAEQGEEGEGFAVDDAIILLPLENERRGGEVLRRGFGGPAVVGGRVRDSGALEVVLGKP